MAAADEEEAPFTFYQLFEEGWTVCTLCDQEAANGPASLRQNDVATSFWSDNLIITLLLRFILISHYCTFIMRDMDFSRLTKFD